MGRGTLYKEIEGEELRCVECGKLLARTEIEQSKYQIKCTRCGCVNSLFRGVTDQVVITDSDGFIVYANAALESITGYKLDEVLGKKPSLWGGQMSPEFYKDMWKVIKTEKKPIQVVVTNKKKDGTLYKAKLQISPVFGIGKEIKMFVGVESVIK